MDDITATKEEQKAINALKRLVRRWRNYADGCDRELKRDADPDSGLVLSPEGRIQYEQSAIIYRKCADELANSLL